MAARHGTRTRYNQGCHCSDCSEANRAYQRAYQRGEKPDATVVRSLSGAASSSDGPGATELAVLTEIESLSTAGSRPGLVAVALAHARVLDDPQAISQHASNGHRLAEVLERLRKGSDAKQGRLAAVRSMSRGNSAAG